MKTLVFLQRTLVPKGGPSAVGYYYAQELDRRGDHYFEFISGGTAFNDLHSKEEQIPHFLRNIYKNLKLIVKTNIELGGNYKLAKVDFSRYDVVHFHDTKSLYLRRKELKDYKGIIMLQSHSPQPLGQELYNSLPPIVRFFVPFIKKRFEKMDRYAFERADYIVFPCKYAEEPYFNNWPYYKTIYENKKTHYRYVLTGIPEAQPKRGRTEVREGLGLSDDAFLVSYVGRHNHVKGFDLLKDIATKFFQKEDNAWVVSAGNETPIKRLDHSHWIEIGWTTDAHSYIAASDVFVLPNRETYFDIVMLEILSLGRIVVASRTGGNRYFEKAGCQGVLLYDTVEEAVSLLQKICGMSKEERKKLGVSNKAFYNERLTVSSMYDSYIKLLKEIGKENNIPM